jgi:hypothetical protein
MQLTESLMSLIFIQMDRELEHRLNNYMLNNHLLSSKWLGKFKSRRCLFHFTIRRLLSRQHGIVKARTSCL